MNVTILYFGDDIRVHKTGCSDIDKETRSRRVTTMYAMDTASRQEVARDFYSDFIHEGSMTEDEALAYSHFLPCTKGLVM